MTRVIATQQEKEVILRGTPGKEAITKRINYEAAGTFATVEL